METRESLNKHLNSIAALHYNKSFTPTVQEEKLEQTARNLSKLYQAPIRQFKKVTDPEKPLSPYQQVTYYINLLFLVFKNALTIKYFKILFRWWRL